MTTEGASWRPAAAVPSDPASVRSSTRASQGDGSGGAGVGPAVGSSRSIRRQSRQDGASKTGRRGRMGPQEQVEAVSQTNLLLTESHNNIQMDI